MIGDSGIGTYLRSLLPYLISARPEWAFSVLGDPAELQQEPWGWAASVSIIPCRAPIYSLTEQWQLVRRTPPATQLFWSPHYNFPVGVRSKLLVTVHDVCHLALPELIRGPHRRAYARWMFRALR